MLTPEEIERMEGLNPKTPAQLREEEDVRRFLGGGRLHRRRPRLVHTTEPPTLGSGLNRSCGGFLMTIRYAAVFLFVLALGSSVRLWAHQGHDHKVMGTVTMSAADQIMVKDTDGKDVTVKSKGHQGQSQAGDQGRGDQGRDPGGRHGGRAEGQDDGGEDHRAWRCAGRQLKPTVPLTAVRSVLVNDVHRRRRRRAKRRCEKRRA